MKHNAEQFELFPPHSQMEFWPFRVGSLVKIRKGRRGTYDAKYRVISEDLFALLEFCKSGERELRLRYRCPTEVPLLRISRDNWKPHCQPHLLIPQDELVRV